MALRLGSNARVTQVQQQYLNKAHQHPAGCVKRDVRMKQAGGGAGDLERAAQLLSEKVQQEGGKGTPTIHEYYTKRTDMRTDERGEIISDEVNSKEPAAWNETTKTAMAVQAVAEELGESADTVGSKLQELLTLVPGLSSRMQSMKKAHLAKLAMSTGDVANKLVLLSTYFPSANIGKLCAARPDVLVMSEDDIREAADTLYELLGNLDVSYMVECEPIFLNKDAVEDAVKQAQRLFPERGLRFLERDPKQILSLQGKDQLIEYDNGSLKQVNETLKARAGEEADSDLAAPEGW